MKFVILLSAVLALSELHSAASSPGLQLRDIGRDTACDIEKGVYNNHRCNPDEICKLVGFDWGSYYECVKQEPRYKCYDWSTNDLQNIRQGGSNIEIQKRTCEGHPSFIFSKGDASKAPGCGSCWCCQPF